MRNWLVLLVAFLTLGSVTSACGAAHQDVLPARRVEVAVAASADAAFAERVEQFSRTEGFRFRRDGIAPAEQGQVQWQLDRKGIQIAGADVWERGKFAFFIYRMQPDSAVSDAELDRLMNAFVASVGTVPGVTVGPVTRIPAAPAP